MTHQANVKKFVFNFILNNYFSQELLLCVVKNLFDEYQFFQDYPERELKTTAEVYGGIIRENIVQ